MAGRANTRKNLPELLETRSKLDDPTPPPRQIPQHHLSIVRQRTVRAKKRGKNSASSLTYRSPIDSNINFQLEQRVRTYVYGTLKGNAKKKGEEERKDRREVATINRWRFNRDTLPILRTKRGKKGGGGWVDGWMGGETHRNRDGGWRERKERNVRKRADRETIVNDGRLKCPLGPEAGSRGQPGLDWQMIREICIRCEVFACQFGWKSRAYTYPAICSLSVLPWTKTEEIKMCAPSLSLSLPSLRLSNPSVDPCLPTIDPTLSLSLVSFRWTVGKCADRKPGCEGFVSCNLKMIVEQILRFGNLEMISSYCVHSFSAISVLRDAIQNFVRIYSWPRFNSTQKYLEQRRERIWIWVGFESGFRFFFLHNVI